VIVLTLDMLRKKTFSSRLVIELRNDLQEGKTSLLSIVDGGELTAADLSLLYANGRQEVGKANSAIEDFSRLISLSLKLPQSNTRELKVWVHQVTAEGGSGELAAVSILTTGSQQQELELSASRDQTVVRMDNEPSELEIRLQKPS
jgi:hypothetical protein